MLSKKAQMDKGHSAAPSTISPNSSGSNQVAKLKITPEGGLCLVGDSDVLQSKDGSTNGQQQQQQQQKQQFFATRAPDGKWNLLMAPTSDPSRLFLVQPAAGQRFQVAGNLPGGVMTFGGPGSEGRAETTLTTATRSGAGSRQARTSIREHADGVSNSTCSPITVALPVAQLRAVSSSSPFVAQTPSTTTTLTSSDASSTPAKEFFKGSTSRSYRFRPVNPFDMKRAATSKLRGGSGKGQKHGGTSPKGKRSSPRLALAVSGSKSVVVQLAGEENRGEKEVVSPADFTQHLMSGLQLRGETSKSDSLSIAATTTTSTPTTMTTTNVAVSTTATFLISSAATTTASSISANLSLSSSDVSSTLPTSPTDHPVRSLGGLSSSPKASESGNDACSVTGDDDDGLSPAETPSSDDGGENAASSSKRSEYHSAADRDGEGRLGSFLSSPQCSTEDSSQNVPDDYLGTSVPDADYVSPSQRETAGSYQSDTPVISVHDVNPTSFNDACEKLAVHDNRRQSNKLREESRNDVTDGVNHPADFTPENTNSRRSTRTVHITDDITQSSVGEDDAAGSDSDDTDSYFSFSDQAALRQRSSVRRVAGATEAASEQTSDSQDTIVSEVTQDTRSSEPTEDLLPSGRTDSDYEGSLASTRESAALKKSPRRRSSTRSKSREGTGIHEDDAEVGDLSDNGQDDTGRQLRPRLSLRISRKDIQDQAGRRGAASVVELTDEDENTSRALDRIQALCDVSETRPRDPETSVEDQIASEIGDLSTNATGPTDNSQTPTTAELVLTFEKGKKKKMKKCKKKKKVEICIEESETSNTAETVADTAEKEERQEGTAVTSECEIAGHDGNEEAETETQKKRPLITSDDDSETSETATKKQRVITSDDDVGDSVSEAVPVIASDEEFEKSSTTVKEKGKKKKKQKKAVIVSDNEELKASDITVPLAETQKKKKRKKSKIDEDDVLETETVQTESQETNESDFTPKISSVFSLSTGDIDAQFGSDSDTEGMMMQMGSDAMTSHEPHTVEDPQDVCKPAFVVLERLTDHDIFFLSRRFRAARANARARCSEHCRQRTLRYLCELKLIDCCRPKSGAPKRAAERVEEKVAEPARKEIDAAETQASEETKASEENQAGATAEEPPKKKKRKERCDKGKRRKKKRGDSTDDAQSGADVAVVNDDVQQKEKRKVDGSTFASRLAAETGKSVQIIGPDKRVVKVYQPPLLAPAPSSTIPTTSGNRVITIPRSSNLLPITALPSLPSGHRVIAVPPMGALASPVSSATPRLITLPVVSSSSSSNSSMSTTRIIMAPTTTATASYGLPRIARGMPVSAAQTTTSSSLKDSTRASLQQALSRASASLSKTNRVIIASPPSSSATKTATSTVVLGTQAASVVGATSSASTALSVAETSGASATSLSATSVLAGGQKFFMVQLGNRNVLVPVSSTSTVSVTSTTATASTTPAISVISAASTTSQGVTFSVPAATSQTLTLGSTAIRAALTSSTLSTTAPGYVPGSMAKVVMATRQRAPVSLVTRPPGTNTPTNSPTASAILFQNRSNVRPNQAWVGPQTVTVTRAGENRVLVLPSGVRISAAGISSTSSSPRFSVVGGRGSAIITARPAGATSLLKLSPAQPRLAHPAKRGSNLTEEQRRAKRARLEKKYPLPPGVVIKTEPETSGYNESGLTSQASVAVTSVTGSTYRLLTNPDRTVTAVRVLSSAGGRANRTTAITPNIFRVSPPPGTVINPATTATTTATSVSNTPATVTSVSNVSAATATTTTTTATIASTTLETVSSAGSSTSASQPSAEVITVDMSPTSSPVPRAAPSPASTSQTSEVSDAVRETSRSETISETSNSSAPSPTASQSAGSPAPSPAPVPRPPSVPTPSSTSSSSSSATTTTTTITATTPSSTSLPPGSVSASPLASLGAMWVRQAAQSPDALLQINTTSLQSERARRLRETLARQMERLDDVNRQRALQALAKRLGVGEAELNASGENTSGGNTESNPAGENSDSGTARENSSAGEGDTDSSTVKESSDSGATSASTAGVTVCRSELDSVLTETSELGTTREDTAAGVGDSGSNMAAENAAAVVENNLSTESDATASGESGRGLGLVEENAATGGSDIDSRNERKNTDAEDDREADNVRETTATSGDGGNSGTIIESAGDTAADEGDIDPNTVRDHTSAEADHDTDMVRESTATTDES